MTNINFITSDVKILFVTMLARSDDQFFYFALSLFFLDCPITQLYKPDCVISTFFLFKYIILKKSDKTL